MFVCPPFLFITTSSINISLLVSGINNLETIILLNGTNAASLSSSVNMLYPLENRLASYTNEYSNNTENITQISELLGSSYRHLLRVLNRLESEGIIKRNNKKIK